MNGGGIIAFRLRMIMKRSFFEEFFFDLNQGGSTYSLEDKRKELEDLDREWYLKDDWSYTGCDWNMGYEGYQTLPSATMIMGKESIRLYLNGDSRLVQWIYYLSRDWEVLVCL